MTPGTPITRWHRPGTDRPRDNWVRRSGRTVGATPELTSPDMHRPVAPATIDSGLTILSEIFAAQSGRA